MASRPATPSTSPAPAACPALNGTHAGIVGTVPNTTQLLPDRRRSRTPSATTPTRAAARSLLHQVWLHLLLLHQRSRRQQHSIRSTPASPSGRHDAYTTPRRAPRRSASTIRAAAPTASPDHPAADDATRRRCTPRQLADGGQLDRRPSRPRLGLVHDLAELRAISGLPPASRPPTARPTWSRP